MAIRAVLFDAGNILYTRPRRKSVYMGFFQSRGIQEPDLDSTEMKALKLESHAGRISEDEYYEQLMKHQGIENERDFAEGKKLFRQAMLDFDFTENVASTLYRLKANGVKLGIVTNTYNPTKEKLGWFRSIGIAEVWDSFATSCELKMIKPDAGIYLAALEPLGLPPDEALFVGHAQHELDGAKKLGMRTVAFNRDDETVAGDFLIENFSALADLVAEIRGIPDAASGGIVWGWPPEDADGGGSRLSCGRSFQRLAATVSSKMARVKEHRAATRRVVGFAEQ